MTPGDASQLDASPRALPVGRMKQAPPQPTADGAHSRNQSPPGRYDGDESYDQKDNERDEREERNGDRRQHAEDDGDRQPGNWIAQHRHRRTRESAATASEDELMGAPFMAQRAVGLPA